MKVFLILLSTLLAFITLSCSHKPEKSPHEPSISTTSFEKDLTFLKDCSQIRELGTSLWLLTCQRRPHGDRTEIYEWNTDSNLLRRLTFQDGQIWDIMPINHNEFYYSSSYDEFKEQFASIIQGAQIGSEIYLKDRGKTSFKRLTSTKGLELNFFFDSSSKQLYFVHENEKESQIAVLDSKEKTTVRYTAAPDKKVRFPIWVKARKTLYFIEADSTQSRFVVKSISGQAKASDLFKSESKIFQIAAGFADDDLYVGFVTGFGIEIWNLSFQDGCWKSAYRSPDSVSEFYFYDNKSLYLTIKGSLKKVALEATDSTCHPSPPGLGVQSL